MGVRLVIGRAGSGKTRRCFDAIVALLRDAPLRADVIWLLPKQATFMAERELACASGLEGFCGARVVSFEQLAAEVLAECGGGAAPEVNALGRQMVLGMLLRKHEKELKFFSKVARHPGLAARLEATLCEFERCGRDAGGIVAAVEGIEAGKDAEIDLLREKLSDLQLLYSQYTLYLGQERIDPARRMERVLKCMEDAPILRGAHVFVDGFLEFGEHERRMIARLGKVAASVEVTLLMDPDSPVLDAAPPPAVEMGLFHRVEETCRRLTAVCRDEAVELGPPIRLHWTHRFAQETLQVAEQRLFDDADDAQASDPHGIELIEAPDRRAEVDQAARTIRKLISQGVRLREIGVIVRELEDYHHLINASFAEHDIPYFVDRRRTMGHHPLLHFLRSALSAIRYAWRHDAAMGLIKSGLAGLGADEADRLENYVLEHRLRGRVWMRPEPWKWHRRLTRSREGMEIAEVDDSAEIDALRRRVVDGVTPLATLFPTAGAAEPIRRIVAALFATMDRFGVRQTIAQWIQGARVEQRHEEAAEHEQVWAELIALFDQMVDLLGDEQATLADFQEVLEAALETFDLALTPPTIDQVLVGQVDRTRTPDLKAVLVLGLNEGVFPRATREATLFSDSERHELRRRQFELDPDAARKLLDERLLGYLALTRSSERLYVSRSLSDGSGRPLGASVFWAHLRRLFPGLTPTALPRDQRLDPNLIGTPRQLLTTLMRWVREGGGAAPQTPPEGALPEPARPANPEGIVVPDARPALYQWMANYPAGDDPIAMLRYRAWKALSYDNTAWLSEDVAKELFPRPLRVSPGQIEMFASCAYRHFLRYGLRLRERDDDDVPELNLEAAYHQVLESLVREMLSRREDWAALTPDQCAQIVRRYARQVGQSLAGELMLSNPRNRYLLQRIERSLEQVICNQQAVSRRGGFRAKHANVEFGADSASSLPPLILHTTAGDEVHLAGRIDRVDVLEEESAAAIIDYRLHGGELQLGRVEHGLSLELLTYLLVVEAHGDKLSGKRLTPAAAFYVRLLRQLELVDHPSEALEIEDPRFHLRGKQRGIFDGSFLRFLDNAMEGGSSDVVAARLRKDGAFGFKSTTDVAETRELAALLTQVREVLARIGGQILSGTIDISPYRIQTATPCGWCEYRSVCRFDSAINRYHQIILRKRDEVLAGAPGDNS